MDNCDGHITYIYRIGGYNVTINPIPFPCDITVFVFVIITSSICIFHRIGKYGMYQTREVM